MLISDAGQTEKEITKWVIQGRRAIKQLNSIVWGYQIIKNIKTRISKTLIESISIYGSEVWALNKKDHNRLKVLEVDWCTAML